MKAEVAWPFFGFRDDRGRCLPYVGLQGPALSTEQAILLDELSTRVEFLGFTSYFTFPACKPTVDDRDYGAICRAWCHCYRNPERYLPPGKPQMFAAFSDFTDYANARPESLFPHQNRGALWDFAYVCQSGPWNELAKNWELARRTIPVLCRDLQLKGVLVGREHVEDLPACADRLTVLGELPWHELMSVFFRSRFLFVPNELDPSPRILAEALCMNTPVVVNRHILGGWHYVNPFTGAFFEDERDVVTAARYCLERWTSPRRWFIAHHGPLRAGERLKGLVARFDPSVRGCSRLELVVKLGGAEGIGSREEGLDLED